MTTKFLYTLSAVLLCSTLSLRGQDLNFAEVSDLTKWYNPSIQQERQTSLSLNYRDVRYESMVAYRSTAGMFNLPLQKREQKNSGFWNLNLGFSVDQADQNILNTTQAQMGLSYALPLNAAQTYMAVSIQGAYVNSQLNLTNTSFPDQFDQYGPIAGAVTQDPLASGDSRKWYSSHLGVSVFKQSEQLSWNLGLSLRDAVSPQINRETGSTYRLRPTWGIQSGCTFGLNQTRYNLSGIANWKSEAFQALFAASMSQEIGNGSLHSLGFGMAYRLRDAFIPSMSVGFAQTKLTLFYDVNISGINASGRNRNAFELALKHSFSKK